MKIAIQGHPTRGNEVIQILESLGGKNGYDQLGSNERFVYFINNIGCIYSVTPQMCSNERKIYTLEEFEKEFPFKIGDMVLILGAKSPNKIIALELCMNRLCYKLNNGLHYDSETLKPYKEMKEERNITLTLDKAKEWYKKGGELKEIALQAFSEKELNPLPRSWKEFAANNARMGYYISADGKPLMCASSGKLSSPHVCPSKKSAEAHLALIQLEQLRDCWRQGWKPVCHSTSYAIKRSNDEIHVIQAYTVSAFLSFPTKEMAEDFLACFRDLIEKAGDLI